ncbi:MAG: phosphatidate cytidylyltransferase [Mycoplasma sp.]
MNEIHIPHGVSINKLNSKSKKTFKTRSLSSVGILTFTLFSFIFSVLSDTKWGWSGEVGLIVNQVFAFMQIALMIVIIAFSAIEVTNLHFYKNKLILSMSFLSILVIALAPTMVYFGDLYGYYNIDSSTTFFYYILATFLAFVVVSLVNVVILLFQGLSYTKRIFIHILIINAVGLFVNAWLYFSLCKGWTTMFILYAITSGTDVYAYLGGMLFGKRKMSPHISPNKTIGGGIIGVFGSMVTSIIFLACFTQIPPEFNILGNFFGIVFDPTIGVSPFVNSIPWWSSVIAILLVLASISIVGDLAFSYIKRSYGVKDFSNLIPGHGGMLDRIDSLIFVVCSYLGFSALIAIFSSTSNFF